MTHKKMIPFMMGGLLAAVAAVTMTAARAAEPVSLAGQWNYRLDPKDAGIAEGWPGKLAPEGQTELPGTTDSRGIGPVNNRMDDQSKLTRSHRYQGPAWFEREIEVPPSWAGKAVILELERVQWESQVWVDGRHAGMQDSLSVPHVYDLSQLLTPGMKHRLTVCVNNRIKHLIHHSRAQLIWLHAITDETQGNWNGIIGRMELRAEPLVAIEHVRIATPEAKAVEAEIRINNRTGKPMEVALTAQAGPVGEGVVAQKITLPPGVSTHPARVALKAGAQRWDEFHPALHALQITLEAPAVSDQRRVSFGIVDFKAGPYQFEMNARPIYLRGNLENAIWPLTGHPPMTPEGGWRKLMATLKEYGMNHLRFHSWCPPEAAFAAADEAGIILQPELPLWDGSGNVAGVPERTGWLAAEARRILDAYGHHPSFRLFSLGNENASSRFGDDPWLMNLVRELKKEYPHILHTSTSGSVFESSDDDFFVHALSRTGWIRGLTKAKSGRVSFAAELPGINHVDTYKRPIVCHEIGQYSMFFNPDEIPKYTGVMKPRNLEIFRAAMEKNGILDKAEPFRQSSARFQHRLYKQEIEQILATPRLPGFQALGIQDYTGQGTTMCGILDAFWEPKGVHDSAAWRRFCAPTVLLARFEEQVMTAGETFEASVKVAHYGPDDLKAVSVCWELRDGDRTVAAGKLAPTDLPTGKLTEVGAIRQPLAGLMPPPARVNLALRIEGQPVANDWDLWVFPADNKAPEPPAGVVVATQWDEACKQALAHGRDVILLPDSRELVREVPTRWMPVFWNYPMFRGQPPTIGIHLEPSHPLFAAFPTESHSDAQWQKLLDDGAAAIDMTGLPFRPVVWVIDDFHAGAGSFTLQRKLGALLEARVGEGRLLVCTLNLKAENRQWPEVRQFLASLYAYAGSPRFAPAQTATVGELDTLLKARTIQRSDAPPAGLDKALLHVAAAGNANPGESKPDAKMDKVLRSSAGFDYKVTCQKMLNSEQGSAWQGQRLVIAVTVPEKFKGRLAARFCDFSPRRNSNAHIFFNGLDQSLVGPHYPARWVVFNMDASEAGVREFVLEANYAAGANPAASDLAVMEGGGE